MGGTRRPKATMCWPKRSSAISRRVWNFLESDRLPVTRETKHKIRYLHPALFQSRYCLAQHAIAEVTLADSQQLGTAPFLLDCFEIGRASCRERGEMLVGVGVVQKK